MCTLRGVTTLVADTGSRDPIFTSPPQNILFKKKQESFASVLLGELFGEKGNRRQQQQARKRRRRNMKLTSTLVALVATVAYAMEDRGCVDSTTLQDGTDLFPVKVAPTHSEYWDVEYFNTYKIVTNKEFDLTYLLYQCGTEPPADQMDGRHVAVLEIPLSEVAISATPMISYMEQLGLRDEISTFLSSAAYVASPCFAADIASGEVSSLDRGNEQTAPSFTGLNPPDETKLTSFVASYEASDPPPLSNHAIVVSEDEETTNNAIFEWVKFFAVFFNKEELANQVFEAAESRFECVSENAGQVAADQGKRSKLLWGKFRFFAY